MLYLYCDDILRRAELSRALKKHGVIHSVLAAGELERARDGVVLWVCDEPCVHDVPTVGAERFGKLGEAWLDSDTVALLRSFSEDTSEFASDLISFEDGTVFYIGYELKLTPTERTLLRFLALRGARGADNAELLAVCIGDVHRKLSNVSQHISAINAKGMKIGGRRLVLRDGSGHYRMAEFI